MDLNLDFSNDRFFEYASTPRPLKAEATDELGSTWAVSSLIVTNEWADHEVTRLS